MVQIFVILLERARVAQLVEHSTDTRGVPGSNPGTRTRIKKDPHECEPLKLFHPFVASTCGGVRCGGLGHPTPSHRCGIR